MSVDLRWDDEPCTVLHVAIYGRWTWDDLLKSAWHINAMCSERTHRMDLLIDLLNMTYRPPRSANEFSGFLESLPVLTNVEMVVFAVNDFTRYLFHPAMRESPFPFPFEFAPGLDEGREIIRLARNGKALPAYFS